MKALKSGHTELIAKNGDISARVPVDVLFVEKVEAEPKTVELVEGGESVEMKAHAYDYLGKELKDRSPIFKSLDPKVVSMGQNAAFGLAPGETTIEVQVDGVKTSVKATVAADKKKK